VALKPKKPFALTKPVQLLVYGTGTTGLQDSYGRYIDGGNNATAVLSRHGATITAVASHPTQLRQAVGPDAVDVMLERDDAIDLRHFTRTAHAKHHLSGRPGM